MLADEQAAELVRLEREQQARDADAAEVRRAEHERAERARAAERLASLLRAAASAAHAAHGGAAEAQAVVLAAQREVDVVVVAAERRDVEARSVWVQSAHIAAVTLFLKKGGRNLSNKRDYHVHKPREKVEDR